RRLRGLLRLVVGRDGERLAEVAIRAERRRAHRRAERAGGVGRRGLAERDRGRARDAVAGGERGEGGGRGGRAEAAAGQRDVVAGRVAGPVGMERGRRRRGGREGRRGTGRGEDEKRTSAGHVAPPWVPAWSMCLERTAAPQVSQMPPPPYGC